MKKPLSSGKIFNSKNLMMFIFFTFIASTLYVTVNIFTAPFAAPSTEATVRVKNDYVMILLQCILGLFVMMIPNYLQRRFGLHIPPAMLIIFSVFLYLTIYWGEVRAFYYTVPHWDTMLHTYSGTALCALGFSIAGMINNSKSDSFSLPPLFITLFAFGFALSIGVIWEIYEFIVDCILNANMQTYVLETGEPLVGQAALVDTMKDLIVSTSGAFVMSVIGYLSLKSKKEWLERFQLKLNN